MSRSRRDVERAAGSREGTALAGLHTPVQRQVGAAAARWLGMGNAESLGSPDAAVRRAMFRRALAAADILAAACALLVLQWTSTRPLRAEAYLLLPLVVLGAKLIGLYDRDDVVIERSSLDEAPTIFQLATLCSLSVWLADTEFVQGRLNRAPVLALWLSLFLLLTLFRMLARRVIRRVAPEQRCLLVGDEASNARLRAKLSSRNGLNTKPDRLGRPCREPWSVPW